MFVCLAVCPGVDLRLLGWEFYKRTKLRIPVQKRSYSFVENLRNQVLGCSAFGISCAV